MNKIALLYLIFFPATLFGQFNNNFQIKNGHVYYQKIFEVSGQSKDTLTRQLNASLALLPYVHNVRADDSGFTASISQMQISYSGLSGLLEDYMFANLVVQVKEGKYRIVIKDIYFKDDTKLENNITDFTDYSGKSGVISRKPVKEFSASLGVDHVLLNMNQYFSELFNYSNLPLKDDW
jgi:hypothetical protein